MTEEAVKGFRSKAAFCLASVWDTAAQAGAGHGIPFLNEKITKKVVLEPNDELDLEAGALNGDASSKKFSGSFDTYLRYSGLDKLFAHLFGDDSISTIDASTTYRHEMTLQNAKEGLFGTLVINKGNVQIEEYAGCKIVGCTITLKPGRAMVTWEVVCSSLAYNTDTGMNTLTTFADCTVPTGNEAVMFQHLSAWIKPVSNTAAFDSNDLVHLNEVVISIKQPVVEDDYSTRGGTIIDEPLADGKWDVTVKMGFRKFRVGSQPTGNSALFAADLSKTKYKAKLLMTGPAIGSGTNSNLMTFWFPNIQSEDIDANVASANLPPASITFRAHRAASLPTGFMTGATGPVALEIQNENSVAGDA